MNNQEIYPWQLTLWQRFSATRERLPHALLLHGRQGVGKLAFAQALAYALLCEQVDDQGFACGTCLSCGWLAQGNHPDFRLVESEDRAGAEDEENNATSSVKAKKKSRFIVVDQIRALSDLVGLSTHRHGLRIIVLHPAETLNPNAANALLKMLEEPPPSTLFILVTHQLQRLLPTIRSRCHKIAMPVPTKGESEAWLAGQGIAAPIFSLAFAGGAPLAALEMDNAVVREDVELLAIHLAQGAHIDPLAVGWGKGDYGAAIDILQKWSYDLLSARLADQVRYYPDRLSSLQAIAKSVDLPHLLEFQHKLAEAHAHATHPLNAELQLEALLLRYAQLFPGPVKT